MSFVSFKTFFVKTQILNTSPYTVVWPHVCEVRNKQSAIITSLWTQVQMEIVNYLLTLPVLMSFKDLESKGRFLLPFDYQGLDIPMTLLTYSIRTSNEFCYGLYVIYKLLQTVRVYLLFTMKCMSRNVKYGKKGKSVESQKWVFWRKRR